MKDLNMLIWLSQLGLSIAVPLGGFTLAGLWLRNRFDLGIWVVLAGCAIGMICAIDGLRYSLKAMQMMEKGSRKKEGKSLASSVSFNEHE